MEMTGRVARALWISAADRKSAADEWLVMLDFDKERYLKSARAAIEAMIEPTRAMEQAGFNNNYQRYANAAWDAMIAAALSPSEDK